MGISSVVKSACRKRVRRIFERVLPLKYFICSYILLEFEAGSGERARGVHFQPMNGCVIGEYRLVDEQVSGSLRVPLGHKVMVIRVLASDSEEVKVGDYVVGWAYGENVATCVRYKGCHFGLGGDGRSGLAILRSADTEGILLVVSKVEGLHAYRAFGDKVIIRRQEREKEGSIYLPDVLNYSEGYGVVVSAGGRVENVTAGDTVIYDRSKATVIDRYQAENGNNEALVVVCEKDIYGKVVSEEGGG